MRPYGWHVTADLDGFLARAGGFLRSRPAPHTVPSTVTEELHTRDLHAYGAGAPVFGWLEKTGEVRGAFFRTPPRRLNVTPLNPEDADALAARLAGLGHALPGVVAALGTATAFAAAWRRRTGVTPTLHKRQRLHRLSALTPPAPLPEGRGRVAGERDRDRLTTWYGEFAAAIGSSAPRDPGSWADARIASGRVTFWETEDGTPVSMAGVSPMVAGQIRVAPVYTPAHLRGRGHAGAVTAEVSRAALAAGAAEVLLFADVANATSTGLYQRVGYRPVTDFAVYDFPGRG
ncbi:GNAT family N-acetyltransferase [Streptomyces thermolilacinus]